MPQKLNFTLNSETVEPIFGSVGAMEVMGDSEYTTAVTGAYFDTAPETAGLYVVKPNSEVMYFDLQKSQVSADDTVSSSILFQDQDGTSYLLRELTSEDGEWLSKYKVEIPLVAAQKKVLTESGPAVEELLDIKLPQGLPFFESLVFYYEPDMEDVYELTYISSAGAFKRVDASWKPSDIASEKYDGLAVMELDPVASKEALDKFDEGDSLPVKIASKYTLQF